ncbi:MAG: response regulator transcription factor [Myxococcota bacterium]
MARLLLVEDDAPLAEALAIALAQDGHSVEREGDGRAALASILAHPPDLVISDVNMPGLDGFQLTKRLREAGFWAPILILTARDGEIDEALGLELGADDYVEKPASARVLSARVQALLRRERLRREPAGAAPLAHRGLTLDPERLEASFQGAPLSLTLTEFKILECLMRRPGVVLSRAQILDQIRGDGTHVADRIIDTYVRRLRKKLGEERIETVVGAGYRFQR